MRVRSFKTITFSLGKEKVIQRETGQKNPALGVSLVSFARVSFRKEKRGFAFS
jgi:hypothetical protein